MLKTKIFQTNPILPQSCVRQDGEGEKLMIQRYRDTTVGRITSQVPRHSGSLTTEEIANVKIKLRSPLSFIAPVPPFQI